jgi:nucleoside-diphosphate-sugar epimerase
MTLLITGATGFIGRHVCAQLTHHHNVYAVLRQPETQLPLLRQQVDDLGGQGDRLHALQGDLDSPNLGLQKDLPAFQAIIHLGARFAWQMDSIVAHRTNVAGSLMVAELAQRQNCRLVFISGFMLENHEHLLRLGIQDDPELVDWQRVYRRAGAYKASKLEAAIRVRAMAVANALDFVEVQPATVAGHSQTGALDVSQPLFNLLDNLAKGRMAMIPGSPKHWLPLVAVDHLAELIATAATSEVVPPQLLALDPSTPNLQGLLSIAADILGRRAPQHYVPIPLLSALLHLPGLPRLMNTWPEALHFIQPTRYNTTSTDSFLRDHGLKRPLIDEVIATSASWYQQLSAQTK